MVIRLDERAEMMFEAFLTFKKREGHCSLPYDYYDNPKIRALGRHPVKLEIRDFKGKSVYT